MSFWSRIFGRKESQARSALAMNQLGKAVPTPRNYEAFSKEGYQINVIAFKCVSIISKAAASIEWDLYSKRAGMNERQEIESHPLLDLLKSPNPMQGQSAFFEAMIAYYMIAGNSYLEAVGPSPQSVPMELWPIRPDKMKIVPGKTGLPQAYEFTANQKVIVYPVDQISGDSQILHLKTFHPTDNWYGMSPIEAAMYSIDQHNESGVWNLSLLQNMATPSGVVTVKEDAANPLGTLPDVQFNNVREQLKARTQGAKNAGRVLLLEGGMDWKQMGFSPRDMDWMEGRKMSARDIALAFGVPPIILNIPGDSTFANYKEARLSMYEDTVIPLMDFIRDELNTWLVPRFGDNLSLDYDVDSIVALDTKRSEKFSLISGAGFLTINEKRAAVGYDPIDGGDTLLVPSGQIALLDATAPMEEDPFEETPEEPTDSGETEDDNEDGAEDSDESLDDEIEQSSNHLIDLIEVKQINPLGKRDRIRVWHNVNKERDKLSTAMELDLREDFEKLSDAIEKAAKGIDPKLVEFHVLRAIADGSKIIKSTIEKHFSRAIKRFGEPVLASGKSLLPREMEQKTRIRFLDFSKRFVEKHAADSISLIEGTNMRQAKKVIKRVLAEGLDEGQPVTEISGELRKEFDSLTRSRANTIARTEISIASNEGALEAAKALDLPELTKEWVSVNDDRTRPGNFDGGNLEVPNHIVMNGAIVGLNEKFEVPPGESMDGPGDPSASAGNLINCRCVLTFSRG